SEVCDAESADFAAYLAAGDRIHDASRVDELARCCEQLDALEEERPLLREEQSEALVDGDLRRVGLDLAEVRVDRRIERQVAEAEPEVRTELGVRILALEGAGDGIAQAVRRCCHERLYLDHDAALEIVQSADRTRLQQEARIRASHVGPRVLVAGALHGSLDLESPALHLRAGEAQALERDA